MSERLARQTEVEEAARAPVARAPRPRRRYRWIVVVGLIVVAVVAIVMRPRKPLAVQVERVARGEVAHIVSNSATGELKATHQALLRAEAIGRVAEVRVRRGDRVESGALLVRLDDTDLRAREQEARAALATARANEAQARARAESSRHELERIRGLAQGGLTPQQALDRATDEASLARQTIDVAAASVEQAQAALASIAITRTKVLVRAPFAGTMADVPVGVGDSAVVGAPLGSIVDESDLYVEAPIDEADAPFVRVGQPTRVLLEGRRSDPIEGHVRLVSPTVTRDLRGTRQVVVEVAVPPRDGLRPGTSADVEIVVARRENALSVPTSAIVGRGAERSVFLIEGKVARKRVVTLGVSGWDKTEVLSGVREGERVIESLNLQGLEEGVRVRAVDGRRPERPGGAR